MEAEETPTATGRTSTTSVLASGGYPASVIFIISSYFLFELFYTTIEAECVSRDTPQDYQYEDDSVTKSERFLMTSIKYIPEKHEKMCRIIFYVYYMSCLLWPLITDNLIKTFRCILLCLLFNVVSSFIALSSGLYGRVIREYSIISALLVASIGSGGLKVLFFIHGFDELILPSQENLLRLLISIFYMTANAAYFISLTIIDREKRILLGFEVAWLDVNVVHVIHVVLVILSLSLFLIGNKYYRKLPARKEHMLIKVVGCSIYAVVRKCKNRNQRKEHWLYNAENKFNEKSIEFTRIFLNELVIFLPLPIMWALYNFQLIQWPIQIQYSDAYLGSNIGCLTPQQSNVLNPLMIIILVPITEFIIFPLLAKCRIIKPSQPLRKMSVGGMLVAISFIISAVVENELQKSYETPPSKGEGSWKIFNGLNCSVELQYRHKGLKKLTVKPLDYARVDGLECHYATKVLGHIKLLGNTCNSYSNKEWYGKLAIKEKHAILFFISFKNNSTTCLRVPGYFKTNKTEKVHVSFLFNIHKTVNITIKNKKTDEADKVLLDERKSYARQCSVPGARGITQLIIDKQVIGNTTMLPGGIYVVILNEVADNFYTFKQLTVVPPNNVSVFWLFPQYVAMALGEIFFNLSGIYFCVMQTPSPLRTIVLAIFLSTYCAGDVFILIFKRLQFYKNRVSDFAFFAGVLILVMDNFILLAYRYRYANIFALDEKYGSRNQ